MTTSTVPSRARRPNVAISSLGVDGLMRMSNPCLALVSATLVPALLGVLGSGAVCDFVEDDVRTPHGDVMRRQFTLHPGAVGVIALVFMVLRTLV